MAEAYEYKAPYFGLRDFLFYLVPGSIVLFSILIHTKIFYDKQLKDAWVSLTIFGIVLAYYVGHAIYPLNYYFRRNKILSKILECKCPEKSNTKYCTEDCEKFKSAYLNTVEKHPTIYASEISRDRSLARFSCAMLFPSFLLGVSWSIWFYKTESHSIPWQCIVSFIIGIVISAGFIKRYKWYTKRFLEYVIKFEECDKKDERENEGQGLGMGSRDKE